mgnify:CR=1 FL=1
MDLFTIVVGIVTLISFIIQVRDVFPSHREERKTLLLLSMGIFTGLIISLFSKTTIAIDFIHPFSLLMMFISMCLFGFLFWASLRFTKDNENLLSPQLGKSIENGAIALIVSIIILAISFGKYPPRTSIEALKLTKSELLQLARLSEINNSPERAIEFLKAIEPLFQIKNASSIHNEAKEKNDISPVQKEIQRIESTIDAQISRKNRLGN